MSRDKKKLAAAVGGSEVSAVFQQVVAQVRSQIPEQDMTVDIELYFRSLTVKSGGIPIFAPKKKQSTLEIRLATSVRKEE